ncbi:MAG: hypothetical protein GX493_03230 [Firmicutes bacterium]|nr:hypothetical protein [Bacillota bacterium]
MRKRDRVLFCLGVAFGLVLVIGMLLAEGQSQPVVVFAENFDRATTETFFTPAYRALKTDPSKPMYYRTGGSVAIEAGAVKLGPDGGGRFTVGNTVPDKASTATEAPKGELDLSKPYKIVVKIVALGGNLDKKFQVYVNNNTTSAGNSPAGSASKVYEKPLGSLNAGTTVEITPNVFSPEAFIQLRVESEGIITLDDLLIVYLEEKK